MNDLDADRLSDCMHSALPEAGALRAIEKFAGGQSNPTYRIETDGGSFALRRKPFGPLLPSAHAVDREYRLLRALHPTGFPVPRPHALCEDDRVLGASFYLMDVVSGRTFWDGTLPDLAMAEQSVPNNRIYVLLSEV